ncbi:MAG: VWA domain-containing protein [Minisyncoccia bacterium]
MLLNFKKFHLILIILILTFIFKIYAQTPPNVIINNYQVSIGEIDYSNYPFIRMIVSVIDKNGNPITNLIKNDFQIFENEKRKNIVSVKFLGLKTKPLSILLVLDRSTSMEGEPLKKLKTAANYFVDLLPQDWKIGIVVFGGDIKLVCDFTTDKNKVKNIINSIEVNDATPLYKTIINSVDFIKNEYNRGAIILFTDGVNDEKVPSATENEALNASLLSPVPIYTIGYVSPLYESSGKMGINEKFLNNIANNSRGRFYKTPSLDQLKEIYELISKILISQYEIIYYSNSKNGKINILLSFRDPIDNNLIGGNKEYNLLINTEKFNSPILILQNLFTILGLTWILDLIWLFKWGIYIIIIYILVLLSYIIYDVLKREKNKDLLIHIPFFILYIIFPILFLIFKYNFKFITNLSFYQFILIAVLVSPILALFHFLFYFLVLRKEFSPFEYKRIETGAETIPAPQVEIPKEGEYATEELQPQNIVDKTVSIKKKKLPVIAWLVIIEGEREGEDFRITKNDFKIGRDPNLQCDLVLSDSTVSKEHCKIKVDENNRVFIYDLASENGTYVNDKEIVGPVELKDDDVIKIGKIKFVFKLNKLNS